jgi:hypothetical protein
VSGPSPDRRVDVSLPAGFPPEEIRSLALPELVPVSLPMPAVAIDDPRAAARDALAAALRGRELDGARVALALGSRGLGRYRDLVAGALDALRGAGAHPVLVPAMGSHGGGTPEGQTDVLREYGLLDLGADADANDATREVGRLEGGTTLHASEVALAADALVILNRVKPHTGFRGEIESGPSKMLVVGLGKRAGAAELHALGYDGFAERLTAARDALLQIYPPVVGLSVVEDAAGRPAHVEAVPGDALRRREPELLREARAAMPRLPFEKLDVLVVDRAGKDVSGLGMDPNVTGRHPSGSREPPDPTRIVWLSLTEGSAGNANGMGFADLVPRSLVERIDPVATWTNGLTSTLLPAARMPMVAPDVATCVRMALATCGVAPGRARLAWIDDTEHLERFRVSRAALDEARRIGEELVERGPAEPALTGRD